MDGATAQSCDRRATVLPDAPVPLAAPVGATPGSRIPALDFIRGLCLLVIMFNHAGSLARKLGYQGRELFTPTMLGYSSAAELFFFVSGALIGILYSRPQVTPAMRLVRLSHRAGHLYLYNALAYLALLAGCSLLSTPMLERMELLPMVQAPARSALQFLVMRESPPLLDILALYVGFLLVAIGFVPLARRWPLLALSATLLLHAVCQWPSARAALGMEAAGRGMNPFAWQLPFMLGVLCGQRGLLSRLQAWMMRPRVAAAVIGALVLMTAGFVLDRKLGPSPEWWWSKHVLGVLRLPHAALVLCAYVWLSGVLRDPRMPRAAGWLHEAAASLGRHSLEVFTASIALTYLGAVFIGQARLGTLAYYATLAAMALLLWLFSRHLGWRRKAVRSRTLR